LSDWSDTDLSAYCRRYNVGWVACTTAAARERFARWSPAHPLPTPATADGWQVFGLRRSHTYVLRGAARACEFGPSRVSLTDVVPEDGAVVVSLHYHEGWRVRPAWVGVERDLDPLDPVPFIRLRMPGPVGRITLTWGGPP
jgi:hypothetical protein